MKSWLTWIVVKDLSHALQYCHAFSSSSSSSSASSGWVASSASASLGKGNGWEKIGLVKNTQSSIMSILLANSINHLSWFIYGPLTGSSATPRSSSLTAYHQPVSLLPRRCHLRWDQLRHCAFWWKEPRTFPCANLIARAIAIATKKKNSDTDYENHTFDVFFL